MKKRAFLIHGWEGSPEEGWRPWLKQELEQRGFDVMVPAMPDSATPTMQKWRSHLAQTVGVPDKDCYFVGHSLGCITILRYLESLNENQKVGGVILVAGFGHDLEYEGYKGELASFFQTPVQWDTIKSHCSKFVAIHSEDDPWVPVKHNKLFQEKLNARSIIQNGMKHYGDNDGITKLPIVLDALLGMTNSK